MSYCGPPNPDGTLTINSVSLEGIGGWVHCLDPDVLWQRGKKRGSTRIIPFTSGVATGAVPYGRRYRPTDRAVHVGVHGNVNRTTGLHRNDWRTGAEENFEYLNDQICDPPGTLEGTVVASLLMPSGLTRTAAVIVEDDIEVNSRIEAEDERGAMDLLIICTIRLQVIPAFLAV